MEILKLAPVGKDYLWGGTRLKENFGKQINLNPLAETWECSVHPDGQNKIVNGSFAGMTLAEVLRKKPEYLGTKVGEKKELPILVKFIDAKQNLSVQVHPGDDYAGKHEGDNGKTEMWYVLAAEDEASLIYGFEHPVTEDILREAVTSGELDKHLHKVKIHEGDCFYVPAGTVHGICAGALIAEIQESSNVTYRVYDYDRFDKDGKKRQLHFDKAMAVMDMQPVKAFRKRNRLVYYYPGCSREVLCRCQYFETEHIRVQQGFFFTAREESFQVILCLAGEGQVETMDEQKKPIRVHKGDCLFVPAGIGRCHLIGETELLKVRC